MYCPGRLTLILWQSFCGYFVVCLISVTGGEGIEKTDRCVELPD